VRGKYLISGKERRGARRPRERGIDFHPGFLFVGARALSFFEPCARQPAVHPVPAAAAAAPS
jgi:hypothetical protein